MLEDWILRKKEIEDSKDKLKGADLCNAKLMQAKLKGASLENADLTAAYLIKADLSGANLSGADLTQAVLSEADLSGADFDGAELEDTFLNGANLKDAVNLTCDQLDLANYDKDTIFPHYITINWSPDGLCECIEEK
ncbi:MAG: pentapeptide repeat-containing protein [Nitrospina sp.]|jgi:uncharacterized protein YjbI with pentapeptide repeats|nr:pentapeptide repeat-containing protein [Nitrospina sp.]